MSITVMTEVWKRSQHKGSELLTMLAIADWADDDGYAWPGVTTLARKARLSERNIRYIIRSLESSGELEIQPNKGRGNTNLYRIRLDKLGQTGTNQHETLQTLPPEANFQNLQPSAENLQPSAENLQGVAPNTLVDTSEEPSGSAGAKAPDEAPAPTKKPNKARQIVEAYMAAANVGEPSRIGYKAAANMAKRGLLPEEVPAFVQYMQSDSWCQQNGWDLNTMESRLDKWRNRKANASEPATAGPDVRDMALRYIAIVNDDRRAGAFRTEIPLDQAEAQFRRVADQIAPEDIEDMVLWRWKTRKKPPSILDVWFMVKDWIEAGKPRARRANDSRWY